jgi:hypothetical protein
MPSNYKTSKLNRRKIYDYIEILLNRKLIETEIITLSKLIRETITVQSLNLLHENRLIIKKVTRLKKYVYQHLKGWKTK